MLDGLTDAGLVPLTGYFPAGTPRADLRPVQRGLQRGLGQHHDRPHFQQPAAGAFLTCSLPAA